MSDKSISLEKLKPGEKVFLVDFSLLSSYYDRSIHLLKIEEITKSIEENEHGSRTKVVRILTDKQDLWEKNWSTARFFRSKEDVLEFVNERAKEELDKLI